jgi:hypothetical protein
LGRNTRLVSTVAGTSAPDRDGRSTETVMTTLVTAVRLVVTASAPSRKLSRPEVETSPWPTTRVVGVPV